MRKERSLADCAEGRPDSRAHESVAPLRCRLDTEGKDDSI